MEELLDADIRQKKLKWIELIPAFLVLLLLIWKIQKSLAEHYLFESLSAVGFALVGIAGAIYFFNKSIYYYTLLVVFIAGLIGLLNFTPVKYSFSVIFIRFDPVFLVLLGVHLIVFYKSIESRAQRNKEASRHQQIDSFKSKFRDKTVDELKALTQTKGFREEAKQAATELLKEKGH
ncbi:hypothetical protein [Parvicella tangerina]|nr:hypothetical protein [Parvicella tangerina]